IAKEEAATVRRAVDHENGRPAVTHYRVEAAGDGCSLVRLRLETGRTHQIRVHMTHLGCPLVGDFLYGEETQELPDRFALHSASIRLYQPISGEEISLACPAPPELLTLLNQEELP
ncbi:MAG: RluA family pseudouridine synthase, partial [Ruminiclostridium sp.]|nr:RluA family pseudouridine synthase [Ruminiclostridium sp.]